MSRMLLFGKASSRSSCWFVQKHKSQLKRLFGLSRLGLFRLVSIYFLSQNTILFYQPLTIHAVSRTEPKLVLFRLQSAAN